MQLKIVSESEIERLMKMRGGVGGSPIMTMNVSTTWGGTNQALINDPSSFSWSFGGAQLTGDLMQQPHIFHNDDLSRPY